MSSITTIQSYNLSCSETSRSQQAIKGELKWAKFYCITCLSFPFLVNNPTGGEANVASAGSKSKGNLCPNVSAFDLDGTISNDYLLPAII